MHKAVFFLFVLFFVFFLFLFLFLFALFCFVFFFFFQELAKSVLVRNCVTILKYILNI